MQRILHADRRPKQNHKEENLLALHQELFPKVTFLLRHSQQMYREEDGAVHFWRMKENLQNQLPQSIHWSDARWKACLAAGGGVKRRVQYCTDDSGTIISELFKDIQDAILLIFLYKTMLLFRATSPNIFTMLDVRSIFILSSTLD